MLIECTPEGLDAAIEQIASEAGRHDADTSFPAEAISALASVGALGVTVQSTTSLTQWNVVRAVAAADAVCGRIVERHLEAVERLSRQAPEPLRSDELDAVASGELSLGVWDRDPEPGEGEPAELRRNSDGLTVTGFKVACVGAGGLERAVVAARQPDGTAAWAYVDVRSRVEVDHGWAMLEGEPLSAGHRVRLRGARVIELLRPLPSDAERALASRADLRRAANWAGVSDALADATLDSLQALESDDDRIALAAGRILTAQRTVDLWLADAGLRADADPDADLGALAAQVHAAIAECARTVLGEGARLLGRPQLGPLARARRELAPLPGIERPDEALIAAGRTALRER